MKRIVMINTGGTFSSQRGENGLSPKLTGTQIRNFLGEFEEDLELSTEDYCGQLQHHSGRLGPAGRQN